MFSLVIISILLIAIVAMSIMLVIANKEIRKMSESLRHARKTRDFISNLFANACEEADLLQDSLEEEIEKRNKLEERLNAISLISFLIISKLKNDKNVLVLLTEELKEKNNELSNELDAKKRADIFRQYDNIDDYDVVNFNNYL